MSRQQDYMRQALARVRDIQKNPEVSDKARKDFGALCHKVPALVLNNGLGLTVAYLEAKSSNANDGFDLAHGAIAGLLGRDPANLNDHLVGRPNQSYMLDTFTVLDAWVFYKRFAVSLLGVEAGTDDDLEGAA